MNHLNRALRDIAAGPTFGLAEPATLKFPRCYAGPNNWDNIQPEDFGPEHDFELNDRGDVWLFTPISNAALQWCYYKLPEDAPRWGACSYVIEHKFISDIVERARECGLMTRDDYDEAQEEANAIAHQGERL